MHLLQHASMELYKYDHNTIYNRRTLERRKLKDRIVSICVFIPNFGLVDENSILCVLPRKYNISSYPTRGGHV